MTSVKAIVTKNIVHTKLESGSPMFGRRLTFNSGKNKECFLSVINVWFEIRYSYQKENSVIRDKDLLFSQEVPNNI